MDLDNLPVSPRVLIAIACALVGSMLAMAITAELIWGLFAIPAGLAGYYVPEKLRARSSTEDPNQY